MWKGAAAILKRKPIESSTRPAKVIGLGVLPLLRGNPEASAHASHTGSGKHAVSYMAPELFGGGGFQPAADLYSMGALLHHMVTGAPPVGWETGEGFDDMPSLPDVIRRAMAKRPANRYPSAGSMRTALEWIDVESSSAGRPPAHASSIHPTGKVLSTSGARPIPVAPVVIEELDTRNRQWLQIALLLLLLGTLAFSGFWYRAQMNATEPTVPLGLEAETSDAR